MNKKMNEYLTATKIGDDYGLTASKVNKILEKIGWVEKLDSGWSLTKAGKKIDAIEKIPTSSSKKSFVLWHRNILKNMLLIKEIEITKTLAETYKANVVKGKEFEIYVGKHFERFGCSVEYSGTEQGMQDGNIDLIVNMNDTYILIKCQSWNTEKIKKDDISEFHANYQAYLDNNPEMKEKKTKACFYAPAESFDKSAKTYAETDENLELHVLSFEDERISA